MRRRAFSRTALRRFGSPRRPASRRRASRRRARALADQRRCIASRAQDERHVISRVPRAPMMSAASTCTAYPTLSNGRGATGTAERPMVFRAKKRDPSWRGISQGINWPHTAPDQPRPPGRDARTCADFAATGALVGQADAGSSPVAYRRSPLREPRRASGRSSRTRRVRMRSGPVGPPDLPSMYMMRLCMARAISGGTGHRRPRRR
jgi:hypothetical protein